MLYTDFSKGNTIIYATLTCIIILNYKSHNEEIYVYIYMYVAVCVHYFTYFVFAVKFK